MKAPQGWMKPAAGVTVAKPAMEPTQSPTHPGRPRWIQSMINQRNKATEAAVYEFTAAPTAVPLVAKAEPALKPNQPNQSKAVPKATKGTL